MGNCLRRQSSKVEANDDDYGSVSVSSKICMVEKQSTPDMGEGGVFSSSSSPTSNREIKIKTTKKQLQEFLKTVNVHGMPADQVLSLLINTTGDCFEIHHQRPWRPCLQSIPEMN
ncbi:unnamed protein product [Ilex paraguariensis]|uniref:Uncharacterized protein n=1 Tax=Ilex paraguariensis TaxID=185542 RepID=A0ABC8U431_9AQUA